MQQTLSGLPVSPGIAIGKVFHYRPLSFHIEPACCSDCASELARFEKAHSDALSQIDAIMASFDESQADKAMIFAAHRELILDDELLEMIRESIKGECRTAEYAVFSSFEEFIQLLSMVEDPTIAQRAADLEDLRNRLLRILLVCEEKSLSCLPDDVIIIAHDLLPSDTATLDRGHVLGIATQIGGPTSHSAIIARSMGIPAILGVPNLLNETQDGAMLVLDAVEGKVILSPDENTISAYKEKQRTFRTGLSATAAYLDAEPRTKDGQLIHIGLNIGSDAPDESYRYIDFVGLFRTEFLYMESPRLPSEEEQFLAYRRVLQNAGDSPVTLRTLDIGGDKQLPYLPLPHEDNPFLGQRALRLCFAKEDIFRTQLRAAYRASAYGNLQIMFPMVGSIEELEHAKEIALSVRDELKTQGVDTGTVPLGLMIEIPSIATVADIAVQLSDFASIGTNDLCQYLCAVDRMNPAVSANYQSFSPAMLRTLNSIISAYNAAGKPISVCGEMGGDPKAAMLLVGMGLKKLSMSGSYIAPVKQMLASYTLDEMKKAADAALKCKTEAEVLALLNDIFKK